MPGMERTMPHSQLVTIAQSVCDEYARTHSRASLTVGDEKVPGRYPVSIYAGTSDGSRYPGTIAYVTDDLRRIAAELDRDHATATLWLSVHGTINGKAVRADLSGTTRSGEPTRAPWPTWYSWHRDELTDSARSHLSAIFRAVFDAIIAAEPFDALWSRHLEHVAERVAEVSAWADDMRAAIATQTAGRAS